MKFKEKSLKTVSEDTKNFEEYIPEQKAIKKGLSRRNFLKSSTVLALAGGITVGVDPLNCLNGLSGRRSSPP